MTRTAVSLACALISTAGLFAQFPGSTAPDLSAIKPVVVYKASDGNEKRLELTLGNLINQGAGIKGGFMGFGAKARFAFGTLGATADSSTTADVTAIRLEGYSPKVHGAAGSFYLLKFIVAGDKRIVAIDNAEPAKDNIKEVRDRDKLAKGEDGVWSFVVSKSLEPGSYLVAPVNTMTGWIMAPFWDFDVNSN